MAYLSKKYKESWDRGQQLESSFFEVLKRFDPKCRKSTREEQFRHIDFVSQSLGSFDVKARKRINRSDKSEQDELIWIEFKNVAGNNGWLYGQADYIAFEQSDHFVVVERKHLVGLAESKCNLKQIVDNSSKALYHGYSRKDRKDLISIIKMSDIKQLPIQIYKK
jgi:hypothetical protein